MTAKEIRELSLTEIESKIRDTRDALLVDRLKKDTGQVEKTHSLRERRKDIARLQTILRDKRAKATA